MNFLIRVTKNKKIANNAAANTINTAQTQKKNIFIQLTKDQKVFHIFF